MSSIMHPPVTPNTPNRPAMHLGMVPPITPATAGTFAPGTKVQVGNHRVIVEKYLSEGGFAHVYLVRLPKPVDGEDVAVLKRVAVPDKETLANMRTEVETMKKLKGHRYIVRYIDSHASQLKGGGYEVFLLMEYCNGGGLIDFMNTRLQNRLTEPEIVKIFSNVAQGVACMHYLQPPLLHRDLKVENVLITASGTSKTFKLCDFGSAAQPRPAATNAAEGRLIEEDIQRHTTMQYRSPEMIDVYRKQPIDEKSDIWALGVLLYKLCYYTTPFEEQGQMAILNASFKFPGYPPFSDRLKKLIAMMLQENPRSRPNIYQVIEETCKMRGTDVPIKNIYVGRTASEARRNQELPAAPSTTASPPVVGASYKPAPIAQKQSIPEIAPMRRGRPTALSAEHHSTKPSPSPRRAVATDPFTALDGSKPTSSSGDADDISKRFPSLDQFSLFHETGGKFSFDQKPEASDQPRDLSQRVTEALADEAFAVAPVSKADVSIQSKSVPNLVSRINAGTQTDLPQSSQFLKKSTMISTGTMTSPRTNEPLSDSSRLIYRFPPSDHQRSSSQSRVAAPSKDDTSDLSLRPRPNLSEHRSKSQTPTFSTLKMPLSARPSLDGGRPQAGELDSQIPRTRSGTLRNRPVSATLESAARFIGRSRSPSQTKTTEPESYPTKNEEAITDDNDMTRISSNVEFLKHMEEEEPHKRKEKRVSSGSKYGKRSSLTSTLSGTKNLLAGRFGDAFKRFESNNTSEHHEHDALDSNLTPIAGSVATENLNDDRDVLEETEEMPPEMRRELERRRLSQEEHRVAEAGAAYKQRVAEAASGIVPGHSRDTSRAALIQNKVQALLDESGKASPTRTAEGYGRFTRTSQSNGPPSPNLQQQPPQQQQRQLLQPRPSSSLSSQVPNAPQPSYSIHTGPNATRPSAPPKPQVLRTGGSIRGEGLISPTAPVKPSHLVSKTNTAPAAAPISVKEGSPLSPEDWEKQFAKRYPSLQGLEMVETEIADGRGRGIRDV